MGLANQVMDLNVANLLIRSPRSHGLHIGAWYDVDGANDATTTLLLDFGSTSANADDGFARFLPRDVCVFKELAIENNIPVNKTKMTDTVIFQ